MKTAEWNGHILSNASALFRNYRVITGHSFTKDLDEAKKEDGSIDMAEFSIDLYVAMRRSADRNLEGKSYNEISSEVCLTDLESDSEGSLLRTMMDLCIEGKKMTSPQPMQEEKK